LGGNKSRSWLYQGAQGGVGVALSALFKQRIGRISPFPGSISWVLGPFPKLWGTNPRNAVQTGRRATQSGIAWHYARFGARFSGISMIASGRAAPFLDFRLGRVPHSFPPADSVRAHRTRHAVFIWFISALLLDQQALVATARSASQHIAHRTWHRRMVPRSPQYIYHS